MNIAIVAAAGQGTRMGGDVPKQFRLLAGTPLIIHTLRRFEEAEAIGEIIVVTADEMRANFLQLTARYSLRKLSRVVIGGATRAESVWRGLQQVRAATAEIVLVHDAARPFITPAEINRIVEVAREHDAAILACAATDTIKIVEDGAVLETPLRERVFHALTPQAFRYEILLRAYKQALAENDFSATDDSALVERLGVRVRVVEGDARNIKITRTEDWQAAERIMKEIRS